ncbi:MAG TPA: nucleotide exchange factor GrpE [Clostridiales bacterium]|jgi:molecular chaperone GrpE|nr:nucleotide exchange factor GrpE [Clostridiales bacterium]
MAKGKKHDAVNEIEQELEETEKTLAESNKNNKIKDESQTIDTITETKEEADEIKKKNEEIEALNNRLLRLQADYLNYKDRTEKEKHTIYGDAVTAVICDLLPVIDNLERAIAADVSETDNFKEGVVMVYNQLMGILSKKGLKEIDALHKPFDHNLHYGVAFEECEEYDDGIIIDVLQKGYTVNGKLLRPSMVRICKMS